MSQSILWSWSKEDIFWIFIFVATSIGMWYFFGEYGEYHFVISWNATQFLSYVATWYQSTSLGGDATSFRSNTFKCLTFKLHLYSSLDYMRMYNTSRAPYPYFFKYLIQEDFPWEIISHSDQRIEWNDPLGHMQVKGQSFSKNLEKS